MEINMNIKRNLQIRAFYLFYIITSIQTGVGVLSAPRYIFAKAHQDAWLSIIITLIYMLIVVFVMFTILNQYENADIFGIQTDVFGKWIGKILGTIYILFFIAELLSVLLIYIEAIQTFIYSTLHSFIIGSLLLILTVYSVRGGLRVVVGVIFIFFFLSIWIFALLYDPMLRMEMTLFQPMFQASFIELLKGSLETSYSFFGFEILFLIYPFIMNKENAKTPVYLGVSFSAFIVLFTTIISIGYYSPHDFEKMDWAVLTLFKSVSFSFLERFDYIIVVVWMMVSLTTMILFMWMITYGMKRLYRFPQRKSLYCVAILLLIISSIVKYDYKIHEYSAIVSKIGFWIVFVYPLLLLPFVLLKKKWYKRKEAIKQ